MPVNVFVVNESAQYWRSSFVMLTSWVRLGSDPVLGKSMIKSFRVIGW
jgi:hypothetical protein